MGKHSERGSEREGKQSESKRVDNTTRESAVPSCETGLCTVRKGIIQWCSCCLRVVYSGAAAVSLLCRFLY